MKFSLKGNKIYFDEYFYLDLNKQTILDFDLKNRDEINLDEYREIIRRRAESMGYFLLNRKDYTKRELYQKLLSKYKEKAVISSVISNFIKLGYLNDYDYAEIYIKSHNYSKKKMEFMLLQKGISLEIIKELLRDCQDKELKEIKRQWIKLGEKPEEKKILSLIRKGFGYRDIQKAIKEIKESY